MELLSVTSDLLCRSPYYSISICLKRIDLGTRVLTFRLWCYSQMLWWTRKTPSRFWAFISQLLDEQIGSGRRAAWSAVLGEILRPFHTSQERTLNQQCLPVTRGRRVTINPHVWTNDMEWYFSKTFFPNYFHCSFSLTTDHWGVSIPSPSMVCHPPLGTLMLHLYYKGK